MWWEITGKISERFRWDLAIGWRKHYCSATVGCQRDRQGNPVADIWTRRLRSAWWRRLVRRNQRRWGRFAPAVEQASSVNNARMLSFHYLSVFLVIRDNLSNGGASQLWWFVVVFGCGDWELGFRCLKFWFFLHLLVNISGNLNMFIKL